MWVLQEDVEDYIRAVFVTDAMTVNSLFRATSSKKLLTYIAQSPMLMINDRKCRMMAIYSVIWWSLGV